MEEKLQAEQIQNLDEEQLTAITGGFMKSLLGEDTKSMNVRLQGNPGKGIQPNLVAGEHFAARIKDNIRENANKNFEVRKNWTNRLTR